MTAGSISKTEVLTTFWNWILLRFGVLRLNGVWVSYSSGNVIKPWNEFTCPCVESKRYLSRCERTEYSESRYSPIIAKLGWCTVLLGSKPRRFPVLPSRTKGFCPQFYIGTTGNLQSINFTLSKWNNCAQVPSMSKNE